MSKRFRSNDSADHWSGVAETESVGQSAVEAESVAVGLAAVEAESEAVGRLVFMEFKDPQAPGVTFTP